MKAVVAYEPSDGTFEALVNTRVGPSFTGQYPNCHTSRLHNVMNSFVSDDISTYAAWRANIRKYQIYQNLANESLTDLKQRLMWVAA